MKLEPLLCPACSGAVPLGEGAVAKCPYCSGDVAIPETYLKLRDNDREEIAARAKAAELLAKLGAPLPLPILVFQKLAIAALILACSLFGLAFLLGAILAISEGGGGVILTLIFAVFVGLLAVPIAWEWMWHALADRLHVDLVDRITGFGAHLLLGVFVLVFLLVPLVLGYYARSIIAARTKLQQMFASKPPHRPGGPDTCRHCDAPLDVPAGALGVRCVYCGTDNLVAVSRGVLKAATRSAAKSHKAIDEAIGEQSTARDDLKAQLKAIAIVGLVLIPLFGGLGLLTEVIMDEGGSPGHMTRASGPPMLYGEGEKRAMGEVVLDCTYCTFYVPLARGETIAAHGGDTLSLERRDIGPWYHLDWWGWTELERGPVKHTGWYRIVVQSAKPDQKMTWSVR